MSDFSIFWEALEKGLPGVLLIAVGVLWRLLMAKMKESKEDRSKIEAEHTAQLIALVDRYEGIAENLLASRVEHTALMRDIITPTIERNTNVHEMVIDTVRVLTSQIEAQDVSEQRHSEILDIIRNRGQRQESGAGGS